mmetsp:Transcript_133775/g.266918  ORF Transcript_133775/g.266918 Transcript_133775/m.266918 type:complete len:382 (+) Transcript_133775:91-1236(+)
MSSGFKRTPSASSDSDSGAMVERRRHCSREQKNCFPANSDPKARKSICAVKTASFFKDFADILHERIDCLEATVEAHVEAFKEKHDTLSQDLSVHTQLHMQHSEKIVAVDLSVQQLDTTSKRHALAHQHHITAVQNLESAIRSISTSIDQTNRQSAVNDLKLRACEEQCGALDSMFASLVDQSNALKRMVQHRGTAAWSEECTDGHASVVCDDLGARLASVEKDCGALQGHCLSVMTCTRDMDQRLAASAARQSAELASVKACCLSAIRGDTEGRRALSDHLEVDLGRVALSYLADRSSFDKEAQAEFVNDAPQGNPDDVADLAALSVFKLADPKRWQWLVRHHPHKLEGFEAPSLKGTEVVRGVVCSNGSEGGNIDLVAS